MDEFLSPPAGGGFTGPPVMSRRFRSFLPVVIDVETGGFNCATDALLEIAAVMIEFGQDGRLRRGEQPRDPEQPAPVERRGASLGA